MRASWYLLCRGHYWPFTYTHGSPAATSHSPVSRCSCAWCLGSGRVSLHNNTVFWRDRLIKDAPTARRPLLLPGLQRILGQMSDAADLARRFLRLWEDYLAALLSDPAEAEWLQPWVHAASAPPCDPGPRDGAASGRARQPGPTAGAASVAGSSAVATSKPLYPSTGASDPIPSAVGPSIAEAQVTSPVARRPARRRPTRS